MSPCQHTEDDPAITTKYEPDKTGNNFFGKNIGSIKWEDATDSLANYEGTYKYTNKVIEGGVKQTTYTYNKLHQLLQQEETYDIDGSKKKITFIEYYGDDSIPLEDQEDERYELKKSQTVKYDDGQSLPKEFVTTYDHDIYGNLLTQDNPDGTLEVNTYYPAEGSGSDCPTHPFGMVSLLQNNIQNPATNRVGTANPKQITYTYKPIPKKEVAEEAPNVFVVPATETYAGVVITTYNYYEDSKDLDYYGAIKERIVTANGQSETSTYSYALNEGAKTLTETETITGNDRKQLSTSETKLWTNGQVVEEVDENQVVTQYVYDAIGRVTQEIAAAGTNYEVTTNWIYASLKDVSTSDEGVGNIGWVIRESSSACAAETHTYYNHGKQEFKKFIKHDNGNFYQVSQTDYDNLGRETRVARFDHELDGNKIVNTHEQFKTINYGTWSEVREVTTNFNNAVTTKEVNPLELQTTEYTLDDAHNYLLYPKRTTNNLFKEVERLEILKSTDPNSDVYSTQSYQYDGFGRKTSQTSPTQKTVQTSYDDFDRPITITHHDGTATIVEYNDPSEDQLVKSVTVADAQKSETVMGTKEYDDLGRVTSRTVNGSTINYEYDPDQGSVTKAWRTTNARGQTMLFDFIPELDALGRNAGSFESRADWNTAKESENGFTFATTSDAEHPIGSLLTASGNHGSYSYTYTPTGKVQSVTQNVNSKPTVTITYTKRTLLGKPLVIEIVKDGGTPTKIIMTYDQYGRLQTTTQQGITSEYGFDLLGRINSIVVYPEEGSSTTALQTTTIKYNPYIGKESKRTITNGNNMAEIAYSYNLDTLLERRTTTVTGDKSGSLTETFAYDDKDRLHIYTAEGDDFLLPCNENNRPFKRQEITHNALDNLETLITNFPNGETNTAIYNYDGTQLTSINNSLSSGENAYAASITLSYDADGNLDTITSSDSDGTPTETTVFTHNIYSKVSSINGNAYTYDCFNRLLSSGDTVNYYLGNSKLLEHNVGEWLQYLKHGAVPIAEVNSKEVKLLLTDATNTAFGVATGDSVDYTTFSPQGVGVNNARTGFNGEHSDSNTKGYYLGNGNRLYLPHLGIFNSMDSKSPFSIGGINSYRYCGGDSVNFADPEGDFALMAFLISSAVGIAVTAAAEGIRAGISGDKYNWQGVLKKSAVIILTGGIRKAATTTKKGIEITETFTKAASSVIKSNKVTASAAKGVKKATTSVKKAGKAGIRKARGKDHSYKLNKSDEKLARKQVKEAGYVGKMTDLETGKVFDFYSDRADLLHKKPSRMDKFEETTGIGYFSIASHGYKLVKATWEGFQERDSETSEEETGSTQTIPVYSGESFSRFYADDD